MEEKTDMGKILIYRKSNELRRFINESDRPVYMFEFINTQKRLAENSNIIIDITSLIYRLKANPSDLMAANANLVDIDEKTTIIAREECADDAIEFFPFLFDEKNYIYDEEKERIVKDIQLKTILIYNNKQELISFRDYCLGNGIYLISFPSINDILTKDISETNEEMNIIIDLTSLMVSAEGNKSLIYLAEQLFVLEKKVKYIVSVNEAAKVLDLFPLYFDRQDYITSVYTDFKLADIESKTEKVKRIVDEQVELDYVCDYIDSNLFGHSYFKESLRKGLNNYVKLYKAGELPIYSVFLFGKSGIGKTEVARILNKALCKESYLAKINFQNYSSQDALNSLIGSPAGYIGCEHGELSEKISKSNTGVLLCDEFEKTTRPVFSFFLQLLEEGKFTDSLAREYDLRGYIIIFTSNIMNEGDYKKIIPPELQTRFDLVCEFEEPLIEDKRDFLCYLFANAKDKFEEIAELEKSDRESLIELESYSSTSLRELKKEFNNRMMDLIEKKR